MIAALSYRRDIDGLRAIAILAVVGFHALPDLVPGGFTGVDVFFVISGYLITSLVVSAQRATGGFSFLEFYARRIRRLVPAMVVMLAVTTLLGAVILLPSERISLGKSVMAAALFVSNLHFMFVTDYFVPRAEAMPLIHTWTLGVEEQFYLAFPAVFLWLFARGRRLAGWLPAAGIAVLIALSLGAAEWGIRHHPIATFFLPVTRAWEFLAGALLVAVPKLPLGRLSRNGLAAVGLVLIIANAFLYVDHVHYPGIAVLGPVLGAMFVIYAGALGPTLASRLLSLPPFVFVGLVSYSWYLWHWPALSFYRLATFDRGSALALAAIVGASFGLAVLSWRFVEKPFRRPGGRGAGAPRAVPLGLATMVGAAALGCLGWMRVPPFSPAMAQAAHIDDLYSGQGRARVACLFDNESQSAETCTFGAALKGASAGYSVILWGDSHADHFVPMLRELAAARGVRIRQVTRGACPPLIGALRLDRWRPATECAAFNRWAFDVIRRSGPAVETVVIAARWDIYADPQHSLAHGHYYQLVDAAHPKPNPDNTARVFEIHLRRTVEALRALGKNVVIMAQVPEFPVPVPQCVARAVKFGRDDSVCDLPQARVQARNRNFLRLAAELSARLPDVFVLDANSGFCSGGRCAGTVGGRIAYLDDNHLNESGAGALAPFAVVAARLSDSGWPRLLRGVGSVPALNAGQAADDSARLERTVAGARRATGNDAPISSRRP